MGHVILRKKCPSCGRQVYARKTIHFNAESAIYIPHGCKLDNQAVGNVKHRKKLRKKAREEKSHE